MPSEVAPAAALALVGRRLRDRLDRQPLHLQPRAVAADPRRPGVDHVADARHGQRRLGDVGGQHHAPLRVRLEHPLLLGRRQPRVQRQHLDVERSGRAARPPCRGSRARRSGTRARRPGLRAAARRPRRRSRPPGRGRRPRPAGSGPRPDRCGRTPRPPARRRSARLKRSGSIVAEVMISFRSGRRGRIRVHVAEQEVDVQRALVRLVDDDRVVARSSLSRRISASSRPSVISRTRVSRARAVVEAHRVADRPRRAAPSSPRRSARRPCARPAAAAACGRSSRAPARGTAWAAAWSCPSRSRRRRRRPGVADRLQQLLPVRADRELGRIRDQRQPRSPLIAQRSGAGVARARGVLLDRVEHPRPAAARDVVAHALDDQQPRARDRPRGRAAARRRHEPVLACRG